MSTPEEIDRLKAMMANLQALKTQHKQLKREQQEAVKSIKPVRSFVADKLSSIAQTHHEQATLKNDRVSVRRVNKKSHRRPSFAILWEATRTVGAAQGKDNLERELRVAYEKLRERRTTMETELKPVVVGKARRNGKTDDASQRKRKAAAPKEPKPKAVPYARRRRRIAGPDETDDV